MLKPLKNKTNAVKIRELVKVLNQLEKCYKLLEAQKMDSHIDTARAEIHAAYLNVWHHRKYLTKEGPLKRKLRCPPAVSEFVCRDNMPESCLGVLNVDFKVTRKPVNDLITIKAEEVKKTMK